MSFSCLIAGHGHPLVVGLGRINTNSTGGSSLTLAGESHKFSCSTTPSNFKNIQPGLRQIKGRLNKKRTNFKLTLVFATISSTFPSLSAQRSQMHFVVNFGFSPIFYFRSHPKNLTAINYSSASPKLPDV